MVNIQLHDIERIKSKLAKLPKRFTKVVYDEAAMYLIGNYSRGLQYYPPYAGKTKPMKRTYNLRFGWSVNWGMGGKTQVKNRVPYAKYVYTRWSGKPWNWKTIKQIIKAETPEMMKAIKVQIAKEITQEGFSKLY